MRSLFRNTIAAMVCICIMFLFAGVVLGQEVIYSEDFSSDPGFTLDYTPTAGEYFQWDSVEGIYKIRLVEQHMVPKYAVSHDFGIVENESFELSFDLKVVSTSYGFAQGIRFFNPTPVFTATVMCDFLGSHKPRFDIRDGSGLELLTDYPDLNKWYSVNISYSHETGTADILIVERSTHTVLYENLDVSFDPIPFRTCGLGAYTWNMDGTSGEMHYDNIRVLRGGDGLLAHWNFDDCTAKDVTGNGHDGNMDDDPVCIAAQCGQAWLPDGVNDEIEITDNLEDLMFVNQSLSISMWVQIIDNPNVGRTYFYLGRDQTYSSNAEIVMTKIRSGHMDGRLQMYVGHHGALFSAAYSNANGEELPKNEWLHLVGVIDYESQSVRFYLNGVLQDESADLIDFDLSTGSRPFRAQIGAYEHNEFQNGPIDEVMVYDRVLSETEILELYENCASGPGQPVCDAFLTPRRVAIHDSGLGKRNPKSWENRNLDSHSFKIHLMPCKAMDVSVGDSAEVFVDVDASGTFDDDELYPAIVSSTDRDGTATDIAIKVFVGQDLFDNDPLVAVYSVAGLAVADADGNDIDYLQLDTFTPGESIIAGDGPVPSGYILDGNYPNPFNPATSIRFTLFGDAAVKLEVFNVAGQRVSILANGILPAGKHELQWDGRETPSGMYFYRLSVNGGSETGKMLLLK